MMLPRVPLRRVCVSIKDGTHGTFARVTDGVPFLSAKNVQDGRLRVGEDESLISWEDYREVNRGGAFQPGDVLLTIVGSIGRVAVLDRAEGVAFQRSVASLRSGPNILGRFLFWALHSAETQASLMQRARQAAQAGVYLGDVAEVTVPLPPLEVQQQIADYLDSETAKIDALISMSKRQIELLTERRQALITMAVAGDTPMLDGCSG